MWEQYQAAYQSAAKNVRDLVDSEIIPNCVEKVIVGQQLNPTYKRILVQQTTHHILGVVTTEQAEMELNKASVVDAARILSTIVSCAQSATPQPTELSESTPPNLPAQPAPIPTPQPLASPSVQTVPPPIPQPAAQQPAGVPKIRTMKDDMSQNQGVQQTSPAPMSASTEQTYTSTQEAILKEGSQKPKGEIPPPPPPRTV